MFAFDLSILSEEEKKSNPFLNNIQDCGTIKKTKNTRKSKNFNLKNTANKSKNIKDLTKDITKYITKVHIQNDKKLIFNITTINNYKQNEEFDKYKKVKKRD